MLVNEKETLNSEISLEKNQTAILCQVMVLRTFLSQDESFRPTDPGVRHSDWKIDQQNHPGSTVKATMMLGYRKWMSGSLAFIIEYVIIIKYETMHLSNVRNWDAPLMLQFHDV